MTLPIRTTLDDIDRITDYLANKPTGSTIADAKTVLDSKYLDSRKINALKFWDLLVDTDDDRVILTESGRELTKGDSWRKAVLSAIVRNISPYRSVIERAYHKQEESLSSTDVGAHWFEHFPEEVSDSEKVLKDQALCLFHLASGAGLGTIVPGRKGNPTRIDFASEALRAFVQGSSSDRPRQPNRTPRVARPPRIPDGVSDGEPVRVPDASATRTAAYLTRGLVVDCYKLRQRLGAGFSAEVWSASVERIPPGVDLTEGQKVAIKFYTTNALSIPDQVIRVEREYRVAQRLRHPNLIRIYEFVLASPRPFHNFLVMDIAPGPALSSALTTMKFEPSVALQMLAQLLSATDVLHESGALHRDIKPGNIAYAEQDDGSPLCVLLDLGIVSPLFEKSVTAVSRFVGSKHWAPLEQLIGGTLDQRSDLYSIGAVAYNLLVGVEPFSSSTTEAAVAVEMSKSGLKIPDLAGIPAEIVELFNACLSNDPSQRPPSARECLSILKHHGISD